MSRRYQTKYSDNWSTRSGYIRQSNPWAKLERPKGEVSHFVGVLVAGFGLLGIIGGAYALHGILPHHHSVEAHERIR